MKPPELTKWEYDDSMEGLLFFAQLIEELLFDYTLDSYKLPVLNIHSSCWECIDIIRLKQDNPKIQDKHVQYVVAEFIDFLKSDEITKNHFGNDIISKIENNKSANEKKRLDLLLYIHKFLNHNYLSLLKHELIRLIKENGNKKDISRITKSFVVELIYKGYSKEYIYYQNRAFFFRETYKNRIDNVNAIYDFLNTFSMQPINELKAIILLNDRFAEVLSHLSASHLKLIKEDSEEIGAISDRGKDVVKKFIEESKYKYLCLFDKSECYDIYKCRDFAFANIQFLSNLAREFIHSEPFDWHKSILVYNCRSDYYYKLEEPKHKVFNALDVEKRELSPKIERTIIFLFQKGIISAIENEPLRRSFDFHAAALRTQSKENQLLNLWTSLECLLSCMDIPFREICKEYLIPVLSYRYSEKFFRSLLQDIVVFDRINNNKEIRRYISKNICSDNNKLSEKIILLMIEENNEKFNNVMNMLGSHILLKDRIKNIKMLFESSENLLKCIEEHELRIKWHIYRIYRERNAIVHSGESRTNLDYLIENLHSYRDRIIQVLFEVSKKNEHIDSIRDAFIYVKLFVEKQKQLLEKNKNNAISRDNVFISLFGESV